MVNMASNDKVPEDVLSILNSRSQDIFRKIVERYLDPRDPNFDFTQPSPAPPKTNPDTQSLESAYRFRVVYNKRFSPW